MRVEIVISSADHDGRVYLTWTPVQATARLLDGPGAGKSVGVILRNAGTIGQVVFETLRTHKGASTLPLDLPGDGSPVRFWVAGEFSKPSASFGDAVVQVKDARSSQVLGSVPIAIRVRKDAQSLSIRERDRFLVAFGTLNAHGTGRFKEFRDMHTTDAIKQAHGNLGFTPWHRAYLLDLERELQAIDPLVTLPYWRFDKPAPALFTPEFMGSASSNGRVRFTPGHPLETWTTDGDVGIFRSPKFSTNAAPPGLRSEQRTIAFGNGAFAGFWRITQDPATSGIETDPHGNAHTSFSGWIGSVPTAAKDPLFFMLHGNVDRIWAKWQWFYKRELATDPNAFPQTTQAPPGHNLNDTMWPWNGITQASDPTRPPTAPGGSFGMSVITSAPGPTPMVRGMLDFQGVHGGPNLGFCYDDVPFELTDQVIS